MSDLQILYRVDQIPKSAVNAATRRWATSKPGITDPKQDFQSTDQISGKELPYRRLIFAALSPDQVLIVYERGGGRGLYKCFMAIDIRGAEAKPKSAGFVSGQDDIPKNVLKQIASGKYERMSVDDARL